MHPLHPVTLILQTMLTSRSSRLFILAGLTLFQTAQAAISPDVAQVAGRIKTEDYGSAIAAANSALIRSPKDSTLLRLKGVALMEQDQVDEAVRVLREAGSLDPDSIACRYYLGQALAYQGQVHESVRLLEEVQARAQQSEYAQMAAQVLPELRLLSQTTEEIPGTSTETPAKKRFSFNLRLAAEYDDNVPFRANGSPDSSPQESSRLLGSVYLEARPFDQRLDQLPLTLGVAYYGYQSLHERDTLQDYDVTQHGALTYLEHSGVIGNKPYQVRLGGRYEYTEVGYHPYSQNFGLDVSASFQPVSWTVTSLRYALAQENYDLDTILPEFYSRDALSQTIGATQFFYLWKNRVMLGLGYALEMDDTEGSQFQENSHQFTVLTQVALPWRLTLKNTVEYLSETYLDFSPTPRRADDVWRFTTTLSRPLWIDAVTAELGYLYETSGSNKGFADYRRSIYSLGISYNF